MQMVEDLSLKRVFKIKSSATAIIFLPGKKPIPPAQETDRREWWA